MEATERPWRMVSGPLPATWNIETVEEFPRLITTIRESGRPELQAKEEANGRLIVRAVNSHDAMREALQAALFALNLEKDRALKPYENAYGPLREDMKAALARAEEAGA